MELVYNITKAFEKNLRRFSPKDKAKITSRINRLGEFYLEHPGSFHSSVYQPFNVSLLHGLDSSLFTLRVDHKIRVLLTIDEDPLFDQLLITLFRVIKHGELGKAYASIAESLYQAQLTDLAEQVNDGDN